MVQLVNSNSGNRGPEQLKCAVKLEIDDPLYEEHGPLGKRFKHWSSGCSSDLPAQPTHYNPLDEPSPLGLRLRKSPSLLDLIQMRLSQGFSCPPSGLANKENPDATKKKDGKGDVAAASNDKLKASNFPASLLRIGSWECVSRYEGDLVAKCYFAKHKLVWEVLDGPLKSKIEIQWSDITAIKATCPDNEPGTLDIVLARQPLFFRETNPQPRKHTLWQATSDFTSGQASINRRHFLECPQGLLNKHFEKLIQCDPRLNLLSRQPEIILDSPYFETRCSVFDEPEDLKSRSFDQIKKEYVSPFSGFPDTASSCAAQSTSLVPNIQEKAISKETLPLSSDSRDADVNEGIAPEDLKVATATTRWDQLKVPGLCPSMSMSDLMNHIGQCISEQMTSGNLFFDPEGEGHGSKDMLEDISQYLLSDSQLPSASDEQSLMSRVNSLCCLLQKDSATVQNLQIKSDDGNEQTDFVSKSTDGEKGIGGELASDGFANDGLGCKQPPAMSRKDSLGDLLLQLPRIASLPQFLFNIPEDGDNQAR